MSLELNLTMNMGESEAYLNPRFFGKKSNSILKLSMFYILIRWRGGATSKAFRLAISRSRVQILLEATLRNNLRQVVQTYVPLSPSSITWYRSKGGDALRLGG